MAVTLGQYPTNLKCFERKGSNSKRLKYISNSICWDNKTILPHEDFVFCYEIKCPFFLHIRQPLKP